MTTKTLTAADLGMFTGSEQFYRHSINRKIVYSEGTRHVAEAGGAYWLLDELALIQPCDACVGAGLRGRQRQRGLLGGDSVH